MYSPTTSTLGHFIQIRDGLIFSEQFENANYAIDDNWNTLQGVATQSTTQSVDAAMGNNLGIYSMPLSNADISAAYGSLLPGVPAPIIFQAVQDTNQNNTMVSVYYYDTLASGIGAPPGPYMKLALGGGQFIDLGVRNSVSNTNYVAGSGADQFQYTTTASRVLGWNLLQLIYQPSGLGNTSGSWSAYVNNTIAYSGIIPGASNIVAGVYLQGDIFGTSNDSFGFFDSLNVNRDTGVTFFSSDTAPCKTSLYIYNQSYSPLANFTLSQGTPGVTTYNTIQDYAGPEDIWVEAAQSNISVAGNSLETLIQLQAVNNGDYYKYNHVVFPYKIKTYDDIGTSILQTSTAPMGQNENIVTGFRDKINIMAHKISGFGIYGQMQEFYTNSRYGLPFSLAVDTDYTACVPIITGNVGSQTFTVGSNLGVTANNLKINTQYVIEDVYHQYRQYVTVSNVAGSTVTINEILNFNVGGAAAENIQSFQSQYFIRSILFYPALTLLAPTSSDLKIVSPAIPRFDYGGAFIEYLYS